LVSTLVHTKEAHRDFRHDFLTKSIHLTLVESSDSSTLLKFENK